MKYYIPIIASLCATSPAMVYAHDVPTNANFAPAIPHIPYSSSPEDAITPDRFALSTDNGDDARAIQRAADFACSNQSTNKAGTPWVQLLARTYNFLTAVSPKCAIHFSGLENYQAIAWYSLPTADNKKDSGKRDLPPYPGTWIVRENASLPAFNINTQRARGTEIDHMGFYEAYQRPPSETDTSWTPQNGNYNIISSNLNGRIILHDLQFRGVQYGIKLDGGVRDSVIEHIFGQCFNNCIYISHAPDTIYINDIQIKTPWSTNSRVTTYQQEHLDAIMLGRVDNPEFGNIFVYGARSAFHILDDKHPYTPPTGGTIGNGTTHKLIISSLDADFTKWAILIDSSLTSATTLNIGILNHNGGDLSSSNSSRAIEASSALEIQQAAYIQISQLHDQNIDKSSIQFTSPDVMISCPLVQIGSLYEDMASWNNRNGFVAESTKNSCDSSGTKKPDVYIGMPIMRLHSTSIHYTNGEANLFVPLTTQLH